MKKIIKIIFWIIIILLIFALIPKDILNKIKPFFDWEKFVNTLKTGWQNLLNFIKEVTGIDFSSLPQKIKDVLGIDIIKLWQAIKNFLASIFEKLANLFR